MTAHPNRPTGRAEKALDQEQGSLGMTVSFDGGSPTPYGESEIRHDPDHLVILGEMAPDGVARYSGHDAYHYLFLGAANGPKARRHVMEDLRLHGKDKHIGMKEQVMGLDHGLDPQIPFQRLHGSRQGIVNEKVLGRGLAGRDQGPG